jgi:uncharacterized membrane protein YuzA (DUF378 family)
MKVILNRLKEPSTWAGFAALATLFGVSPVVSNAVLHIVGAVSDGASIGGPAGVVQAIVGICAAAAVLIPERKPVA